jgi:hypothetical protein
MRKTLVLSVSLLSLIAGRAGAAGINLGWNDCPSGATYSLSRTFACDTNIGTHTLVGSFVAPAGIVKMSANEIVIDMQTSGATLPEWWGLRTGLCRFGSLTENWDFTGGPFTCYDYWQGGAIGAIRMFDPPVGNRARIKGVFAIAAGDPRITSVPEGTHVYSFKANISNAKTVGPGSCAGCAAEACIVLRSIRLNQPVPFPQPTLTNPVVAQHVIWQSWTDASGECPQVTPAKKQTWGSIKALYR